MAYATQRIWHRVGSAVVAVGALVVGLSASGCDGAETSTASAGTAGKAGDGGSGGTAGSGGTGGSSGSSAAGVSINQCTPDDSGTFSQPFDATPSPDGKTTYFTGNSVDAVNGTSDPAIFSLNCKEAPKVLASGDPLASPFGIATSTDGKTLFIADAASENEDATIKGQIFALPSGGGTPSPIDGTQGYQPRGLEVHDESGTDVIYFSGINPADGLPGVFSIGPSGGAPKIITKGSPFVDPSGVAVAADGTVYVTDTGGSEGATASVIKVKGDSEFVLQDIKVGFPAGLALSMDDKQLFVSGFDPVTDGAVVIVIDLASKTSSLFNKGIENNTESAGLHRAKNANSFAWSDSQAGGSGRVYTVELK